MKWHGIHFWKCPDLTKQTGYSEGMEWDIHLCESGWCRRKKKECPNPPPSPTYVEMFACVDFCRNKIYVFKKKSYIYVLYIYIFCVHLKPGNQALYICLLCRTSPWGLCKLHSVQSTICTQRFCTKKNGRILPRSKHSPQLQTQFPLFFPLTTKTRGTSCRKDLPVHLSQECIAFLVL